ncbi:MAG: CRTAC1 family protein [Candidatus Poribacteria bacterium]|nr:CRTAC1 family protein [Candidatus Poribacteria bacterium]
MKRRNTPIDIFIRFLIVILWGASVPPANADTGIQFVDVTQEAGIHWQHTDGRSGQKYFMETLGSGAAFFDYDADGDPDLYFVNGAPLPGYVADDIPTNCLYRNNGDGTFTDVTEESGVGDTGYGHGCAVGDYNNDGQLDLYVTNYGTNRLYRNNGDGTFTDVAEVAGVTEPRWSSSCAFADYDRDGNLDLYVVNYIVFDIDENPWCGLKEKGIRAYCEPDNFPAQSDTLFRNNGDGTFTDATKSAGIYNTTGKGLGVVWGDYNNDGALDIYVANDSTENLFYHNNSDGTFEEVGFMIGVALSENGAAENGMGTAFGDWNNDGWFDLTVTNYAQQTNTLYHNDADGFFTDATATTKTAQLTYPYLGWATAFIDYDNDGYQDLFVANGHLHENLAELGQQGTYEQRNLLFRNNYNGTFTEVSETLGPGMKLEDVSRGATFADYDSDGDLDIVVTNSNATPRLLRNDGGNRKNYLQIRLVATQGSIDAIGARVKIKIGELTQTREVRSGDGYLSQRDLTLHFGIGDYKQVDSIEIQWQSGVKQLIKSVPANQVLSLEENRDE